MYVHDLKRSRNEKRRKVAKLMTNDVTVPSQCTSTVFREPTPEIQDSNMYLGRL
jgi:hypothetical protein